MTATHAPVAASPTLTSPARRTRILVVAAGVLVAVAANAIVATAAIAAGASASYAALTLPVYGSLTAIGVIVAYLGWSIIRRRSTRPARTLGVVVPVLEVLSYAPDIALLITGFIPGTSALAVGALAVMHLVALAVIIPICLRLAPVR